MNKQIEGVSGNINCIPSHKRPKVLRNLSLLGLYLTKGLSRKTKGRFSVLYFKDLIDRQSGQSEYLP